MKMPNLASIISPILNRHLPGARLIAPALALLLLGQNPAPAGLFGKEKKSEEPAPSAQGPVPAPAAARHEAKVTGFFPDNTASQIRQSRHEIAGTQAVQGILTK